MKELRLGFIGAGFIARFQAEALRNVRGAQLAGVYALKGAEELAAQANKTGIGDCRVYSSVAELCKNVDAVALLAPNFVRVELMEEVTEAVRAGAELKGIICEKPLGRTVAEAKRLVDLVEAGLPCVFRESVAHEVHQSAQHPKPQRKLRANSFWRAARTGGPHEGWFWDPPGRRRAGHGRHSIAVAWYI